MPVTTDKPAPYAPPSVIMELVGRHRTRGLPSPVTAEVLGRAGVSDSLIPRTAQALQALDLLDNDGKPTETMEGLRLAPEAEYKQRLAEWLNAAYADVIAFIDPAKDDEVKVRDAFRTYKPVGQQSRMVTLFMGLYQAAGVTSARAAARSPRPRPTNPLPPIPRQTRSFLVKPLTNHGAAGPLPAAISGLLASLPANGGGWTQERRDKFVTTFGAVLDFCFPIVEEESAEEVSAEAAE